MTARTDTERNPNALVDETSPYLLQHAYNPVDWRPWGEAAFEEARARNVPIFLSVGYSTCYWCHVMERESFEDEGIAAQMNESFVCVKVDREERPDVDDIYMTAVQLISGRGGWPMSVWLTPPGASGADDPGLKPFFAGTYYPAEPRQGMPSFPQVMGNISEIWKNSPEQIIEQADRVAEAVREQVTDETDPVRVDTAHIQQALGQLIRIYDKEHGGFGGAPKFPQPIFPEYLFELRDAIADPATQSTVKRALKKTLDEMATGGIYDQVGGGFHRYSTDRRWLVPHFEKMLYDNAQLVSLYALSAALTGDEYHARIVADTLNYIEREMTSDSGAFYSAQDAEVNEREGLNYLWTKEQIDGALDEDEASFAMKVFGLDAGTNFTDPHHPEDGPKNVLYLPDRPDELAEGMGMEVEAFIEKLDGVRARLCEVRQKREQPGLDDKIITSWNGLMIKAYADAALVLRNRSYLEAGERAAEALHGMMRMEGGALARTARNGEVGTAGVLEDYAMYASGLLALHRASSLFGEGDPNHLTRAQETIDTALETFGDESGALYDTRSDQADLFVRTRTAHDGAMPSGQSVMLHNLIDLYAITSDGAYLERAVALLGSMSRSISSSPLAMVNSVRGLHRLLAIDSSIPDRWGEASEDSRPQEEVETPVSVLTTGERVTVPRDGSVELPIRIEIEEPYHINAHEPGVAGLEPLTVSIAGGSGVAIEADYPAGEAYEGSAVPESMGTLSVHSGAVEFEARLSRSGEPIEGRPLIVVTYQVCSDTECYQPLTVELDVSIDFE